MDPSEKTSGARAGGDSAFVKLKLRLDAAGFKPSSHFGQNFIVDPNLLDAIIRDASLTPGSRVIEVGPGPGTLTLRLAALASHVLAVEIDRRLIEVAREECKHCTNITFVEGDALGGGVRSLHPGILNELNQGPVYVVANLPYSISAPLIANLVTHARPPVASLLLVQKEVAARICAAAGSPEYGALSVAVQSHAVARALRVVPASVFRPRPKVDSQLVSLVARSDRPEPSLLPVLQKCIEAAFRERRKKLAPRLAATFGRSPAWADATLLSVGAGPQIRGETLAPTQFVALARAVASPPVE